jgi:hypothetical protein
MMKGVLKWCVGDIEGLERMRRAGDVKRGRDVSRITIRKKGVLCSTGVKRVVESSTL